MTSAPAIIILGSSALPCARRVQALYPQAQIYGLSGRVTGVEQLYEDFGDTLRALYRASTPIIVLCAAGIVIRSLATVLGEKDREPPVLAVAPCIRNSSCIIAVQAVSTTGKCIGRQPAITALIASFSAVIASPRTGSMTINWSGGIIAHSRQASTASAVGGTIGRPSVQPLL